MLHIEALEKEISAIEEHIASGKSPQEAVLFVGSSSIRKWKLGQSFPDLKTANHGFGGSQLADSVNYFERIVKPMNPSIIVVYAGDNDIASGKTPAGTHGPICVPEILNVLKPRPGQVGFVGDDVVDLPIMLRIGLAVSPRDGHFLVRRHSHWVTPNDGGRGCGRDVCELLMLAQGTFGVEMQRYY